jgi:opacity protein-like surface antigen
MRGNCLVVALSSMLLFAATSASAQEGFGLGYMDIGPTLGLGGINGAGVSVGGRFEKAIKELPNLGNGILGIQASVDYYHYDFDSAFFNDDGGVTVFPVAVTVNYHFQLKNNKKIDPFAGLGIGYQRVSFDCGDFCEGAADSDVYLLLHGGIRYFWKPKLALYADVGAGAANLNIGIMFKLGGD